MDREEKKREGDVGGGREAEGVEDKEGGET